MIDWELAKRDADYIRRLKAEGKHEEVRELTAFRLKVIIGIYFVAGVTLFGMYLYNAP